MWVPGTGHGRLFLASRAGLVTELRQPNMLSERHRWPGEFMDRRTTLAGKIQPNVFQPHIARLKGNEREQDRLLECKYERFYAYLSR